ncbi:hypothetical protein ACN47E_002665 [Coniothyrium glycines]
MAPVQADSASLLHIERISQYVSLPPSSLATPLPALCASIFSPLLLSYFPPARGIVLAYTDVTLSASPPAPQPHPQPSSPRAPSRAPPPVLLLRHVDEYSAPFLWATADLLIWRPRRNAHIAARITHQSNTHISLSYLNAFPVSVLREQLPPAWAWHASSAATPGSTGAVKKGWDGRLSDEGGWWVDGEGEAVRNGREVVVRIRDFDGRMDGKGRGKGFLRVDGSLLSEEEERAREGGKGKGKERASGKTGVLKRSGEVVEVV